MCKIGTLNSRGGNSKILHIIDVIDKHLDILCLQEIHNPSKTNIRQLEYKTKMKCFINPGTDLARGVIIMIRESENKKNSILHSQDDHGNLLIVTVDIINKPVNIFNLYAPNYYGDRVKQFRKCCEVLESDTNFIFCGDFNCIIDLHLDSIRKTQRYFDTHKCDREIKDNKLIAIYKHTIWTTRARLYYGEIERNEIIDTLLNSFKNKLK